MVSWYVPEGLETHVEEAIEVTILIFEPEPPVFVVCALRHDIFMGIRRILLHSWLLCHNIIGSCILALIFLDLHLSTSFLFGILLLLILHHGEEILLLTIRLPLENYVCLLL